MSNGRVIVAKGGRSLEREISLKTSHECEEALRELGYDVTPVDVDHTFVSKISSLKPDFVFIAMHGKGGEDGTMQELLETLGVPYTCADPLASEICMDKILFKRLLRRAGLPTPPFCALEARAFNEFGAGEVLPHAVEELGLPLVLKPAGEGSAQGIKFVDKEDELTSALIGVFAYDDRALLEAHIEGCEVAVSVLGPPDSPEPLPIVEIHSQSGFYSYEAHYEFGGAKLVVPAELDAETAASVEQVAVDAYSAVGCRDLARVDIIIDSDGIPQVLEINTVPGLTQTSLTPVAASAAGITFTELIEKVVARAASNS